MFRARKYRLNLEILPGILLLCFGIGAAQSSKTVTPPDPKDSEATNAYGEKLIKLAKVSYSKDDFFNALKQLDEALSVFRGDPEGEARARLLKGQIAGTIGDTNTALAEISRALELYREIKDERGEGRALMAMGMWQTSNHYENQAIQNLAVALEISRKFGDQESEASALNAMGTAYAYLDEYSKALSYFNNALRLFEKIGASPAAGPTKCAIASAEYKSGKIDEALASYESCLHLSHNAGNLRHEFIAREGIAKIYGDQGRHDLALKQYKDSEEFFKRIRDHRELTMSLNSHGDFYLKVGENQNALDVFKEALSLSDEKVHDKEVRLTTIYNLARANKALGLYESAQSLIEESLKLIEEIRATNVASPDFRLSFFSAVRKHYDLYVEILMQRDRAQPGHAFAAQAFAKNEQGLARVLIDLLVESRLNLRAGAAKELVDKERELRNSIRALSRSRLNLLSSEKDSPELRQIEDEIVRLNTEYQTVQAQLREQDPRLFSFEQFAPVTLERIQQELRDSDTMLLEYSLGEDHSCLWAITSNSIDTYILPPRKEIELAANELYQLLIVRQGPVESILSEKASNLSRMLLGPVAEKLGSRRLVIVKDGALQYIPFEALPAPSEKTAGPVEKFLVDTNEIVVLPSASTLIAIRGTQNRERLQGKLVAIIADPVFDSTDDRVPRQTLSPTVAEAAPDQAKQQTMSNLKLARLTHASEEADAISASAPWGTTLVAKGFDASRETAMSAEVSQSQIVHFASHGFLDSEHPELSGIVLSMTDRNGANTNGLMTLPDIYTLDLSADLVVLSACQTALGKEIKGEGLVGLTHSFMSAGAKSVVATLWKVDDRATAVFMTYFYEGVLQQGMTPAAALRSAQLRMKKETQWSSPYYWAGFVLQGEYTNPITVHRNPWVRQALILLAVLIVIAATLLVLRRRKRRIPPAQFT